MVQIKSNVMRKAKKLALSIDFFHTLLGEYILKQEVVVIEIPEWKYKASLARNTTFDGN